VPKYDGSYWCGTVDIRSQLLGGLILLSSPFIALYFVGLFIYCRLTGRIFLEKEARELEEARFRLPIVLGGKG